MYGCAACGDWSAGRLCRSCTASLVPGPVFATPGGVLVVAAYGHRGAARRLVHGLKYRALPGALAVLAEAMANRLPADAEQLIPVPRARLRRWRHGIDPASELARYVGKLAGLPVHQSLRPAAWWPRHASRGTLPRSRARFVATRAVSGEGTVLVDDVATSGATLDSAAGALGVAHLRALVATSPSRVLPTLVNTNRPAVERVRGRRVPFGNHAGRYALESQAPSTQSNGRGVRPFRQDLPGR